MAKSLDGLIRHLIDQIALCGEHGESTRFLITTLRIRATHPSHVFNLFFTSFHTYCNILYFGILFFLHISSYLFLKPRALQAIIRLGLLLQSSLPWLKHHFVVSNNTNTSPALANKYAGFIIRVLIRIRSLNFRFHYPRQELLL